MMTISEQLLEYLAWIRSRGIENDRPLEQHIIFVAAKHIEELENESNELSSPNPPADRG